MSSLILTLSQDPAAVMECVAAAATAVYLLRLVLHSDFAELEESTEAESERRVSPRLVFPASAARTFEASLREKLLRFFAVGETIIVAKRSLRKQRCRSF